MARQNQQFTEQQKRERALISTMASWDLEPGQMLFMGPKSVAAVTSGGYHPSKMTDLLILERSEWCPQKKPRK